MEKDASNHNEREGEHGRRDADEWAVLPGGEEKDEEMGMGNDGGVMADDDGGGVSSSGAANKVITVEECLKDEYPLHCACKGGASLDVIKYLVEEADGDKGKELLSKVDRPGMYPLHWACEGGASVDVIKYLVEEADGDKGKELLSKVIRRGSNPLHANLFGVSKKDNDYAMYPLHCACKGGASLDVIKYLVEEADGDKGKELLEKGDKFGLYPLHFACEGCASVDVIKYLVEEADSDKGKELLSKADRYGSNPLHHACKGGASLDVIKYLVEEADGDKGKELLCKVDKFGMYPFHWACKGGAPVDVIKYLVEEADGDKGKELLSKVDNTGLYPLHWAVQNGASNEVIKYLIQKNSVPLQHKDRYGQNCLDFMNSDILREIWGRTHQIGTVADKSSDIDRLNYLLYARALVYAARQAEQPGTSLCVGLYGRWGGGKSTLWKQIKKCLEAEFLQEDALLLYNICQLSGESLHPLYRKAAENAKEPFNKAVEKLASDPYVLNDAKKAWREKSERQPPTTSLTFLTLFLAFLEHLAWLFLRIFCACQSCREGYELENDPRNVDDVHIQIAQIKSQDARSRRMEMNAIFFSFFLVLLSPIWIVYYGLIYIHYQVMLEEREENDSDDYNDEKNDDNIKKEAEHIAGIITGDVPLGDGDSAHWDVAPCGTIFVIIFLQIVRAIGSGLSLALAALCDVVCFQWCCSKTNHTPTGAVKYKIVVFNAWTYQGSELLWASLMKDLWDAVEAQFGKKVVRYHRAGISLAEEDQFDESHLSLSPLEKARNRKRALLMFRARSYLSLFLFLIVLTVLLTLTIINCKRVDKTCLGKVVNVTNDSTGIIEAVESGSEEEGNDGGVIAAIIATVAAFCPLLANVIKYWNKVRPFMRKTRGDFILEKASGSTKRKDFKEELGFMGEVKTELEYLFDLLNTETYLDKEIGCNRSLRLCVFIDDLDRCPQKTVVSVLEAVILLLVDGPISVWMAIDSRIVVQCIEAEKAGLFDKANISGHEFLDKIVQLPFTLPELTYDTKKSYLDKIIDEKELDPARVLSRYRKEGLHKKVKDEMMWNAPNKSAFFKLTRIATIFDEKGHIISRHDSKAVIGMTESELIKTLAKNPQNASAEDQENLCSIVSQAIRGYNQETLPDSKENSHTVPVPEASDDFVHIVGPPPSGLYIPMLNENDRRCLEDFMPFIDGNPRRMKRIINVFNLSRRIAELRCEVSPQLTAKILKMVILVEQWPYRMAWLLQLIEDVNQLSTHSLEDSRTNQFLGECFRRDEVRPDELCWDMICRVGILEVYRRIVCKLSMSNVKSSNMGSIDSDPQLFEGLLLCNGNDRHSSSEGPYAISVHDLRPLGCNTEGGGNETCLRSYLFNIPHAVTDKVSIMMSKALINYVWKKSSEEDYKPKIPGIQNLGNTCYLSASLQILYSIPQFLHELYESYEKLSSTKDLPLTRALLEVAVTIGALKESDAPMISPDVARSTLLNSKAANPSALKKHPLMKKFDVDKQHDAHEFLGHLVNSLHDELAAAAVAAVVTTDLPTAEYFHLKVGVCHTCKSCGHSQSKEVLYSHLSVEVGEEPEGESWGVERSLKQFFQAEDIEQYCEECYSDTATKTMVEIISRPKAILLHFKRYIVTQRDNGEMVLRKNKAKILLKHSLSLSSFFSSEEERRLYHLCGVVHHVGNTASSGHYTTCAKRKLDEESAEASPNIEEQWVLYDDTVGKRQTINYVIGDEGNQENCYMALYELKSFDCFADEDDDSYGSENSHIIRWMA